MALPSRPPPLQRYMLLHDSRRGLKMYPFQTAKVLAEGLTVYEDIEDWQHKLLQFLQVTVEHGDYVILRREPPLCGVWL